MSDNSWKPDWIIYCKAAWLADCPIEEFYHCEKAQIDLLMSQYLALDMVKIDISSYGQGVRFWVMSDHLDKRKTNV